MTLRPEPPAAIDAPPLGTEPRAALPNIPAGSGPVRASWKPQAMARQAGLDLKTVAGSSWGGRIVAGDVARFFDRIAQLVGNPALLLVFGDGQKAKETSAVHHSSFIQTPREEV